MLAYCMNVHPGESLEDQSRNLEVHAAAVAARFRQLRPEDAAQPFGVGLRFRRPRRRVRRLARGARPCVPSAPSTRLAHVHVNASRTAPSTAPP